MPRLLWLSLLLVSLSALAHADTWRDSIVFYAPMDGSADAARAGGAPQAKLVGPATFVPGRKRQALSLPQGAGCSYAVEGNFPREAGTFCAWVSLTRDTATWDSSAGSWWQWLLGVRDVPATPEDRNDLRIFFDRSLTLQVASSKPVRAQGMAAVPDVRWAAGTWHHVGLTYRAREYQLYIDGEPRERPVANCDALAALTGRLLLGCSDEGGHNSLGGLVDEVYLLSRPVSAAEMKTIYLATGALADDSGGVALPEPLLAATLDGSTAARLAGVGTKEAQGLGLEFGNWTRGRALLVQRRAYDLKASCAWPDIPGPLPARGTAMLWLKPAGSHPWDGTERGVRRPLLSLRAGASALELTRSADQQLVVALRCPAPAQAAFDVVRWNAADAHHLAFTWDTIAHSLALFVDGRQVATTPLPQAAAFAAGPFAVWLGADDADHYRGDSADAAFRDLRLYREVLTADQIGAVASGREGVPLRPLGLAALPDVSASPAWTAAFRGTGLTESLTEYIGQPPVPGGPHLAASPASAAHFLTGDQTSGPRTYSLWFRLPARSSMSTTARILTVRFRTPEGASATFEDDALSQRLTAAITDGERFFGGTPSTYRLCADSWHHLALVCDQSATSLYLDGALQQRSDIALKLGAIKEITTAGKAALPDVCGWSRALSPQELTALFNYGAADLNAPAAVNEAEQPYWASRTAYHDHEGGVDRVCLNALWRFLPADGITAVPPAGPWGYSRLPGSFSAVHLFKLYDPDLKQLPGETWPDGRGFTSYNEPRYDAGWYERLVDVPAGWQGKRLTLQFDHVAAYVARVCVDGQLRGHFEQTLPGEALLYPPRRVDISDCAGKTIRVSLQLGWDNPGSGDLLAVGDSWLVAEDSPVDFVSVLPVTHFQPTKTLSVRALLHNSGAKQTTVMAEAQVLDGTREALALKSQPVSLQPGETREVVWDANWPGAHPWSPDDPFLYQLVTRLRDSANGAVLKQTHHRLGFREFTISGRDFVLNGKPIHLRGTNANLPYAYPITDPAYLRRLYEARKTLGFNAIQYWADPSVAALGGQSWALDQMLDWCDELGYIAIAGNVSHLQEIKNEAAYAATVDGFCRRYGAHPSICMWFINPNTCWYNFGMHPGNLDCRYQPVEGEPGFANHGLAAVGEQTVREHDPQGRPVFTYASGNFGPLYSAMQYMSLGLTLQEESDWPSLWAESAPKPLMPVETDLKWTPHWADFEAYERSAQDRSPVPMYYVEHAARTLGDAPYLQTNHPGVDTMAFAQPNGDTLWNDLAAEPYVLQLRAQAARDILRGWRGYGMSGVTFHAEEDDLFPTWSRQAPLLPQRSPAELQTPGAKPELKYQWFPRVHDLDHPNEPYHTTFGRNFAPILAFIGGTTLESERKLGDFTSQDHTCYSAERVTRQIVVVNDRTDRDLSATAQWRVVDQAGKTVASDTLPVTVESGHITRLPFAFAAPTVSTRTVLRLELKLKQGDTTLADDTQELQVYPRPASHSLASVSLLDTADGATGKALQAARVPFVPVTKPADLAGAKTLVVGQRALTEGAGALLADWERGGGLQRGANVLVLAQPPTPLANLIFEPAYERYAWPRVPDHPVLKDLTGADLANWRGYSTMAPAYAPPDPAGKSAPHYPGLKWHWGNRGIVSTYPLRKPTYGNFRVLADDGFDLTFSPLLEWLEGPSRVVLCQLDLIERAGLDPVATDLLRRLCAYVAATPAPAWHPAAYLGSDAGGAYLAPHQLHDDAPLPADGVLVTDGGGDAATLTSVQQHLQGGGTVVLVNPSVGTLQSLGLTAKEDKVWHAVLPAAPWPLLAGVSPADLYWRQERTAPVLTDLPPGSRATTPAVIAEIPRGQGRLLVWTVSADLYRDLLTTYENNRFGTHRAYYAKTSNPDKIHRGLSQLLTNLGVRQRHPGLVFFGGDYGQNGKSLNPLFRIPLPTWRFAIDPTDQGRAQGWAAADFADAAWRTLTAPGMWQDQGVNDDNPAFQVEDPAMKRPYNGVAWYRVKVTIPEALRGRELYFDSNGIDDYDEVYCNGQLVGKTGKETPNWWAVPRHYKLPADLLHYGGEDTLAVRVTDTGGGGGFAGKEPPRLQAPAPSTAFSPYLDGLSDYDVNAFHNW